MEEWPYAGTLRAAEGWMELGAIEEAWNVFVSIPPKERTRPEAVILWVRLLSLEKEWGEATRIGRLGIRTHPDCGYLYTRTAYAAARCEGWAAAHSILLSGEHVLKGNPFWEIGVAYYDCQLGNAEACEARMDYVVSTYPEVCRKYVERAEDWY